MSIGRISGQLLKSNLQRDGADLAFETDLLYLDVNNSRIGLKTDSPSYELEVIGTVSSSILRSGELIVDNVNINSSTVGSIVGDLTLQAATETDRITVESTLVVNGSHPFNVVLDEDDFISNRSDAIPTQQSVKAYVDNAIPASIDILLGLPSDTAWTDGAYTGFTPEDNVTDAIDDLNEVINNIRLNTFIRTVDFSANPLAGGAGTTVTLTLDVDGNANQYVVNWGDGTIDTTSDSTPSHTYTSNTNSPFTVSVTARNTSGSGTGSEESETKTDYIIIYTPDPTVGFNLYRDLSGGTALTGNNLYVIEGDNLYLENVSTDTLQGDVEYTVNWDDGTATSSIASDDAAGGVSGARIAHTWAQGTSSGTGSDTVTLTLTSHTTADPTVIPVNGTLTLKVYEDNPAAPNGLNTKTIAFATNQGTGPLLAAGATDNTPGSILSAGDAVSRTTLTTGTIDSTIISTYAYDANAGNLSAVFNDITDGTVILSAANQAGNYTSLNITEEEDYNLLNASGASVSFGNSIYYPGSFTGFKARVRKNASNVNVGINRFNLSHSITGDTNTVEFVKDDVTVAPTVTAGTITEINSGNYRYISGIPYYNTGSPSLQLSGVTINNFIGQTYRNTANVLEVASGTNLEGTSQAAISTQYYDYADIDGASTFLTSGIPNADTGNGTPYAIGDVTINITSSNVRTIEQLRLRAYNVNGTGSYVTNTVPVQVHTAEQIGISEIGISVEDLGNGVYTTEGIRIFDFSADTVDTPSFSSTGVNYYINDIYTETSAKAVEGTQEATVRLGVIEHNVNDYTGYLPAGPNRSADTGTQYFTFAFQRQVVANFTVGIVSSTGISGFWIAAPGTQIDSTSTLSGWLDASLPYNGSGVPGANTGAGGNGSNGCAFTTGDRILPSTALNGTYTLTLGTENLTNATNNVALVRIALSAGQSITSIGIL